METYSIIRDSIYSETSTFRNEQKEAIYSLKRVDHNYTPTDKVIFKILMSIALFSLLMGFLAMFGILDKIFFIFFVGFFWSICSISSIVWIRIRNLFCDRLIIRNSEEEKIDFYSKFCY